MPESALHLAITGTRHQIPSPQEQALVSVLVQISDDWANEPRTAHHGVCTGMDATSHRLLRSIGGWLIEGHPGHDANGKSPWRARDIEADCDVLHPPRRYYLRNRDIAEVCSVLVAAVLYPHDDPRSRTSGTWHAVREGRSFRRPITFVWPDGTVEQERNA